MSADPLDEVLTRQDPTCPDCHTAIYGGDLTIGDGDETLVDCDKCGRQYRVLMEVVYYYHSSRIRAAEEAAKKEARNV